MELSYFPGCSLHATAREYDASTRAVCAELDIGLSELDDWNCCGSTSAHSVDTDVARKLSVRNLRIAERSGLDVMSPCAACYGRMRAAQTSRDGALIGASDVNVCHILDVLADDESAAKLREKVTTPLTELRAVSYYGCLATRPPERTGAADVENPESMDRLLSLAGAEALPWSFKTDCCGASLTLTRTDGRRVGVKFWEKQARMLTQFGRTLMGVMVDEVLRVVSVLRDVDTVDPKQLALTGMSLGGNVSCCAMACVAEIRASAPVCGGVASLLRQILAGHPDRYSSSSYVRQLLRYIDHPQIVLMCICPRPFMTIAPTKIQDMPKSGVDERLRVVEPAYKAVGQSEPFRVYQPDSTLVYP